jgi:hypothetical protein
MEQPLSNNIYNTSCSNDDVSVASPADSYQYNTSHSNNSINLTNLTSLQNSPLSDQNSRSDDNSGDGNIENKTSCSILNNVNVNAPYADTNSYYTGK